MRVTERKKWVVGVVVSGLVAGAANATPSTTYWTPMTMDIQPYKVLHIGVDDYFTVFKKASAGGGSFPTDAGLTIGVLPFERFQMEVGADLLGASDDPLYFNAKAGTPENALCAGAPALQAGVFNAGTKRHVTDQNVLYGVVAKTIPLLGRLSAGPYAGNRKTLVDKDGDPADRGFMAAFDRGFIPGKDGAGNEYKRLVVAADYASGRNAIGGGGFGIYYFLTKDISLLTGPVWFNEKAINGEWKWTIQLDINAASF